jgi:hypothetical protein
MITTEVKNVQQERRRVIRLILKQSMPASEIVRILRLRHLTASSVASIKGQMTRHKMTAETCRREIGRVVQFLRSNYFVPSQSIVEKLRLRCLLPASVAVIKGNFIRERFD